MEDNLSNRIYKAKQLNLNEKLDKRFDSIPTKLNAKEKLDFLHLLTSGCRAKTKRKVFLLLNVPLHLWESYGIYNRVDFYKPESVFSTSMGYTTGQDWLVERQTLLKCLERAFD